MVTEGKLLQLDMLELDRELDRTKSKVFMGKGTAAFLGPMLCSMDFVWDATVQTAATNGRKVWWNPEFFLKLLPETRATVLVHELWHPAYLHGIRRGGRDPEVWNVACDIRINNDLENMGFSFVGIEWCCKDHSYDVNGRMAEEDIYDALMANPPPPPPQGKGGSWGEGDGGDLREPTDEEAREIINSVIRAVHEHKAAGGAGNIPTVITETLAKFLEPLVPWEKELMQFCTDLAEEDYTWARPSRRSQDIYLPSRFLDEGKLRHIVYFLDVSGSCSNADVLRFNSEVKFIKEVLKPDRLTLVQFTCSIMHVAEFYGEDPFEETIRHGTGGTSFECVREYIEKEKPTAAIIFTDLDCAPMQALTHPIPIIWCAVRAAGKSVPFGKLIHMRK